MSEIILSADLPVHLVVVAKMSHRLERVGFGAKTTRNQSCLTVISRKTLECNYGNMDLKIQPNADRFSKLHRGSDKP